MIFKLSAIFIIISSILCTFTRSAPFSNDAAAVKETFERMKNIEQGRSVRFAEPDILFPSEKIPSVPALSKFYVDEKRICGANSDLNQIATAPDSQRPGFISAGAVEIEDFIFRDGLFYILAHDDGTSKITILDIEGKVISQFPLIKPPPSMTSIAVDSNGRIYHNNPSNPEGIITVYDMHGNVKKIFGRHLPERYFASMKLLNRAVMAIDNKDNLIVAFKFEPIVRKYNSSGEIIFDREIDCKEVSRRIGEEKTRYPKRFTITGDNRIKISTFTYFTSIATDEKNNIYVKFGSDSLIFKLSERGELENKYLLAYGDDSIEDFDFWDSSIVVSDGNLYYPVAVEGSESFGYILRYVLHESKGGAP